MAEPQIDPAGIGALLQLDPIIHAPARLSVLTYLSVVERSDFVFLKNMTGLTWGNLSTHLSKLEEAGYVEIEKQFNRLAGQFGQLLYVDLLRPQRQRLEF